MATKPDSEFSGLGDHQSERALQPNPVPRPLHRTRQKLTNAGPLTLCISGAPLGRPVEAHRAGTDLMHLLEQYYPRRMGAVK